MREATAGPTSLVVATILKYLGGKSKQMEINPLEVGTTDEQIMRILGEMFQMGYHHLDKN
jgi:hypothetical protein